jgi:hypothetical protein
MVQDLGIKLSGVECGLALARGLASLESLGAPTRIRVQSLVCLFLGLETIKSTPFTHVTSHGLPFSLIVDLKVKVE